MGFIVRGIGFAFCLLFFSAAAVGEGAKGSHEATAGTAARNAPASKIPKMPDLVKLGKEDREVCDLEREIQILGPMIYSTFGQQGFPTTEHFKQMGEMLRAVVPVLKATDPKVLRRFPNFDYSYEADPPVVGPSADGRISLSFKADPREVAKALKGALDVNRFESQRNEIYGLFNEIATKTGVKVSVHGAMENHISILKQLTPLLDKLPADSALGTIMLSTQPGNKEYLSFSGSSLNISVPGNMKTIPEEVLTKVMTGIPKSEHGVLAGKLEELLKTVEVDENKKRIRSMASDFRNQDPAVSRAKLKEEVAKKPLAPAESNDSLLENPQMKAIARKLGPDVMVKAYAKEDQRIIDILEDLANKGYKLRQPSRTVLITDGSGYGIKKEDGGQFFPQLGGDCLPWTVLDKDATREQILGFFEPPKERKKPESKPDRSVASLQETATVAWREAGGSVDRGGNPVIWLGESHPVPLTPGVVYHLAERSNPPGRLWKWTGSGYVKP